MIFRKLVGTAKRAKSRASPASGGIPGRWHMPVNRPRSDCVRGGLQCSMVQSVSAPITRDFVSATPVVRER